jgi:hypothetical protein
MHQPPALLRREFLGRLRAAHDRDPQAWVLVEDLTRTAFGLPAVGLPISGPTAKGTLGMLQRISVRRVLRELSAGGMVEFAEQLPTERRRRGHGGPLTRARRRRSVWARLAPADAVPRQERRHVDVAPDWRHSPDSPG